MFWGQRLDILEMAMTSLATAAAFGFFAWIGALWVLGRDRG